VALDPSKGIAIVIIGIDHAARHSALILEAVRLAHLGSARSGDIGLSATGGPRVSRSIDRGTSGIPLHF
jgi:hypothetical protein